MIIRKSVKSQLIKEEVKNSLDNKHRILVQPQPNNFAIPFLAPAPRIVHKTDQFQVNDSINERKRTRKPLKSRKRDTELLNLVSTKFEEKYKNLKPELQANQGWSLEKCMNLIKEEDTEEPLHEISNQQEPSDEDSGSEESDESEEMTLAERNTRFLTQREIDRRKSKNTSWCPICTQMIDKSAIITHVNVCLNNQEAEKTFYSQASRKRKRPEAYFHDYELGLMKYKRMKCYENSTDSNQNESEECNPPVAKSRSRSHSGVSIQSTILHDNA